MYMRQSYVGAKSAEIQALLTEDNFITSDAAITQFVGEQNKRNPYSIFRSLIVWRLAPCNTS